MHPDLGVYIVPGADVFAGGWSQHPAAKRIRSAGLWTACNAAEGVVLLPEGIEAYAADLYGEGRPTHDGATYRPPLALPALRDLERFRRPEGTLVDLASGVQVWAAIATMSPRRIAWSHSGASAADLACDWAREVNALWTEVQHGDDGSMRFKCDEVRVLRVVLGVLQASYRITEELLTDLGVLTTADPWPILMAAWGLDPKALRLVVSSLPQQRQDAATSPS